MDEALTAVEECSCCCCDGRWLVYVAYVVVAAADGRCYVDNYCSYCIVGVFGEELVRGLEVISWAL